MPDMHLGNDGILRVDYGFNPILTSDGLMAMLEEQQKIITPPVPVMVKMEGRPQIQANQASIMHTERYLAITTAVAYATREWYVKHLIDKHIKLNKPPLPVFVLDTDEEAIKCLKRYLCAATSIK